MTNAKDLMHGFVESVKGRNYSEVIILAEAEATRAYRKSLCSCGQFHHTSGDWCQYSNTLTLMISFLRCAAKPKHQDRYPYNLFHLVQDEINQHKQSFIQSRRTQRDPSRPASKR